LYKQANQRKFDFRSFGDQFFIRKSDSLEIDNRIKDSNSKKDIAKLRGFYDEFVREIPATGKDELVRQK